MNTAITPLRLAVVASRWWPAANEATAGLERLLSWGGILGAWNSRVLSIRWQSDWPRTLEQTGVRLERLDGVGRGLWAKKKHRREIMQWLEREPCDRLLVSGLGEQAAWCVEHARKLRIPVLLRPEQTGWYGDCYRQLTDRSGRQIKRSCMKANAFLAATRGLQEELIAAGYSRERIRLLMLGCRSGERLTKERRITARRTLAQLRPDLYVPPGAPVVLCCQTLDPNAAGLRRLLATWPAVKRVFPTARLWLVGEGDAAAFGALATQWGTQDIAAPGQFVELDDLFPAANLLVAPQEDPGACLTVLDALAAGLSVVASDAPGHRELIVHGETGWLYPFQSDAGLEEGIVAILAAPGHGEALGHAAADRMQLEHSLERSFQAHDEWLRSIDG